MSKEVSRFIRSVMIVVVLSTVAVAIQADPVLISVSPTAGPAGGGTTITITFVDGSYLCGFDPCAGYGLFIGGVEVPFTKPTPTTLVAVTPPHAPGVVTIQLAPGIGTIGPPAVLTNAFTYAGAEVPALSSLTEMLLAILLGLAGMMLVKRR